MHWRDVEKALRAVAPFAFRATTNSDEPVLVPVMFSRGAVDAQAGRCELMLVTGKATGRSLPLRFEIEPGWIEWSTAVPRPGAALEVCRVLPERWLELRLCGSERELGRLPRGQRERRGPGEVTWTLVDDELGRASLERHLQSVVLRRPHQ